MARDKEINTYFGRIKKFLFYSSFIMFFVFFFIAIPQYGIRKAVILGFIMTIFLWLGLIMGPYSLIEYLFLRRAFKKYKRKDYSIRPVREIEINNKKNELINLTIDAIKKLKHIRNIEVDSENGICKAYRRSRFSSQGQYITVKISELSDKMSSVVYIKSEPAIKTAVFDLARNYKNVEMILAELSMPYTRLAES